MRVTSSIWVSALIRRVEAEGAYAMVISKGSPEAGAIFVVMTSSAEGYSLFGPAPQMLYSADLPTDRMFECLIENAPSEEVDQRLERERSFDPDIWIVEIQDREGRSFLNLAKEI